MQQRDAIRRVLARLRELDEAVERAALDDGRSQTLRDGDVWMACEERDGHRAHLAPLLAALAQAVVEAPVLLPARRYIERTEAIDAALDALAEEDRDV